MSYNRKRTNSFELGLAPKKAAPLFHNRIENDRSTLDRLLSPKQVAELLGVKPKFVYERMARGEFEVQPVGRLRKVKEKSVKAWLNHQKEISGG